MNTNVIPMFAYGSHQLRGVMIDGQPWFVAADVCRILGLRGDVSLICRRLEDDERRVIDTPTEHRGAGVAQRRTYVSRPGLFKLIQRSNKPAAKAFDRWVRHEVLPQIMDNGGYMTKDADVTAVTEASPANAAEICRS